MQTDPATSIGQTTATLNGEILSPNGTVSESGFVYSTTSDPVIGPAPDMPGLWLNFGHGHHGFTLGPATGELLAQIDLHVQPLTMIPQVEI